MTLNESVLRLKEELHSVDSQRSKIEHEHQHLQKELNETQRKMSVAEASIEVASRVSGWSLRWVGLRLALKGPVE